MPHTPAEEFANWLTRQMLDHGYTPVASCRAQAALAKDCGISRSLIRAALRGRQVPHTTALGEIARVFGVQVLPLVEMCGYLGDGPNTQPPLHVVPD
jgi:transcriptional regulator with XRE-family HTH domain